MKKKRPEQEKKIVNVVSIKKYYLVFGVILTLLFLLYLLFGPKLRIFFKKNQLKDLNIILITLDTLRADFVSAYGKGRAETKNLDYYLTLPYSILLVPDEDGWYAEVPELPGCMTCGDTKERVLKLIEDAKRSWLEVSLEHGDPIPERTRAH